MARRGGRGGQIVPKPPRACRARPAARSLARSSGSARRAVVRALRPCIDPAGAVAAGVVGVRRRARVRAGQRLRFAEAGVGAGGVQALRVGDLRGVIQRA